jgi:hypothetical protein
LDAFFMTTAFGIDGGSVRGRCPDPIWCKSETAAFGYPRERMWKQRAIAFGYPRQAPYFKRRAAVSASQRFGSAKVPRG